MICTMARQGGGAATELCARHQNVARNLAGAAGKFVAQPTRSRRIAFQHALKKAACDPDRGGVFQGDRRRWPFHRGNQRQFPDQRAGSRDDPSTAIILDPERATLNDKAGIGLLAHMEQYAATRDKALLGTDRQHAQACRSQQAECRDTLEQDNIILDRHERLVPAFRTSCSTAAPSFHELWKVWASGNRCVRRTAPYCSSALSHHGTSL